RALPTRRAVSGRESVRQGDPRLRRGEVLPPRSRRRAARGAGAPATARRRVAARQRPAGRPQGGDRPDPDHRHRADRAAGAGSETAGTARSGRSEHWDGLWLAAEHRPLRAWWGALRRQVLILAVSFQPSALLPYGAPQS